MAETQNQQQADKSVRWAGMTGQQRARFVAKVFTMLITMGYIFPHVLIDG